MKVWHMICDPLNMPIATHLWMPNQLGNTYHANTLVFYSLPQTICLIMNLLYCVWDSGEEWTGRRVNGLNSLLCYCVWMEAMFLPLLCQICPYSLGTRPAAPSWSGQGFLSNSPASSYLYSCLSNVILILRSWKQCGHTHPDCKLHAHNFCKKRCIRNALQFERAPET